MEEENMKFHNNDNMIVFIFVVAVFFKMITQKIENRRGRKIEIYELFILFSRIFIVIFYFSYFYVILPPQKTKMTIKNYLT